jgi:hypothetical protein
MDTDEEQRQHARDSRAHRLPFQWNVSSLPSGNVNRTALSA